MNKKLSIITPYHDTLSYTQELAKVLVPQLTDEVEWIIVDDGDNEQELDKINATIIHLRENSGNASTPRNVGLDNAQGEYITFVDSDDLVKEDYISNIINKINEEDFDYCYFSWETKNYTYIIEDKPAEWNTCVWDCIYKKELIGNNRFNPNISLGEDKDFNARVIQGKKANIKDILYHYNWLERDNCISAIHRRKDHE